MGNRKDIRLLRFQTVLGSGAEAALPFVVRVLEEPPRLEPDLATSFNLEADDPAELTGTAGVSDGEEVSDRDVALAAFLLPRKVLLTETDLKLWGFFTADEARA